MPLPHCSACMSQQPHEASLFFLAVQTSRRAGRRWNQTTRCTIRMFRSPSCWMTAWRCAPLLEPPSAFCLLLFGLSAAPGVRLGGAARRVLADGLEVCETVPAQLSVGFCKA